MEMKFETPIGTICMANSQMKKLKRLIVIIIATILVISIVSIVINITKNVVVYSGLEVREAEEILSILETNKMYTDYNPELGTIAVKEKDVENFKITLALWGYSSGDSQEE